MREFKKTVGNQKSMCGKQPGSLLAYVDGEQVEEALATSWTKKVLLLVFQFFSTECCRIQFSVKKKGAY
jgi:hypothetical protein